MRGARVRFYYGILLIAVTLWWANCSDVSEKSYDNNSNQLLSNSKHTHLRKSSIKPRNTILVEQNQNENKSKNEQEESNLPTTVNIIDLTTPSHYVSEQTRSNVGQINADNNIDVVKESETFPSSDNSKHSFDTNETLRNSKDEIRNNVDKKDDGSETSLKSVTEPVTEESRTYREYKSVHQTAPFVTTTSSKNAAKNNVVTTTTSRSTKIEQVSLYTEEDDEAEDEDKEESDEEEKESGMDKGDGKETDKDVKTNADHSTTLRTGKILAGKQIYDLSEPSVATLGAGSRKSYHDYNFDSYPIINSGGHYRKPVSTYYENGASGNIGPNVGGNGRKPAGPPSFDVRKPLYEFESTYGNGKRPSSFEPNYGTRKPPPYQDFNGNRNPYNSDVLFGAGGTPPSKNQFSDPAAVGQTTIRRPYSDLSTVKIPATYNTYVGTSTGGNGLTPSSPVYRKPSQSSSGLGLSSSIPPSRRPMFSSPDTFEGGFKPILSSNYNELPSQAVGAAGSSAGLNRIRVKPSRVPSQTEATSTLVGNATGGNNIFNAGGNFNNIGLNMLYKETNVLNHDFLTQEKNVSNKSKHPTTTNANPYHNENNNDIVQTTIVNDFEINENGFNKRINRTKIVKNTQPVSMTTTTSTSAPVTVAGNSASTGLVDEDSNESQNSEEELFNKPDNTEFTITTSTTTEPNFKYKLRKPALLVNGTKKVIETNSNLIETTSRKPIIKNNIKTRISNHRVKGSTTTTTTTTPTPMPTTTINPEDLDLDDVELTTTIPPNELVDHKPSIKPIVGFNQRKRPTNKLNYLSASSVEQSSSPASLSAASPIVPPPPSLRLSNNTRVRKPIVTTTQSPTTTPAGGTEKAIKKIKPFVNWASRLHKYNNGDDVSTEITTTSDGDFDDTDVPSNPLSVSAENSTESDHRLTSLLTTKPTSTSNDGQYESTTAKLYENTIPNKIKEEIDSDKLENKIKASSIEKLGDSKKDDNVNKFTVKDFISNFNEDSSATNIEKYEQSSLNNAHPVHTVRSTTTETMLNISSSETSKSPADSTTLSTTNSWKQSPPIIELSSELTPSSSTTEKQIIHIESTTITDDHKDEVENTNLYPSTTETLPNKTTTSVSVSEDLYELNTKNDDFQMKHDQSESKLFEKVTKSEDKTLTKLEDVIKTVEDRNDQKETDKENLNKDNVKDMEKSELDDRKTDFTTINEDESIKLDENEEKARLKVNDIVRKADEMEETTHKIVEDVVKTDNTVFDKFENNLSPSTVTEEVTQLIIEKKLNEETSPPELKFDITSEHSPISSSTESSNTKGKDDVFEWSSNMFDFSTKVSSTSETDKMSSTTTQSSLNHEEMMHRGEGVSSDSMDELTIFSTEDESMMFSSMSATTPSEVTTKQTFIVSMRTSSTTTPKMDDASTTTSRSTSPTLSDFPVTSEGDYYSVDDVVPISPIITQAPLPAPVPDLAYDKQFVEMTIQSTPELLPSDLCSSLPQLAKSIIHLFGSGSMRVRTLDQMQVANKDFLCSLSEKQELYVVEFCLADAMGVCNNDINKEFISLYKTFGMEADFQILGVDLIGEESSEEKEYAVTGKEASPDDEHRRQTSPPPPPPPENSPRVLAAIVIASVAAVCFVIILILLFIMRKKGRSFNNRKSCIPVSLDDYSLDNVSVYNSVRRKGRLRASKRSYANLGFDDPNVPSHAIAFATLSNFCQDRRAMDEEYNSIPVISVKPDELPPGVEDKNRYANVIPIPETRVHLSSNGDAASPVDDYINANYVKGPKNEEKFYIACQAPVQDTIEDFWKMIWVHQTKTILMITNLYENQIEKCADYLPPSEVLDCHRVFGDFQITLKKREVREKYVISNLQIKNLETNLWREVVHVWYTNWPATGVPEEENSIIAFLIEARSYMKNATGPHVVHCSPGTGRTGTVIACDILIRHFETTRVVDVPRWVYNIRRCRAGAVQTKDQYAFIYRVLNVYASKLTGGALDSI